MLESRYVRFIPYLNGEMNLTGLSALGVGYCLTAFQNENQGSTHLILDVRGIERFINYSDRIQNQYGSVAKVGCGYSIGRMKFLEGGLTLEDGRYLGLELGYSQIVSIPKRNRTPKRFGKAKNMVKCP
ncbi:hypothetical protein [Jiulongibacter sediminis]|nr:hypothetical protein [Jiulongibacter sediminis]